MAEPCLEEDEETESDNHWGEDDRDIESCIEPWFCGETASGEKVAHGDGEEQGKECGDGAAEEAEAEGVLYFAGAESVEEIAWGAVSGCGAEEASEEEEIGGGDDASADPQRVDSPAALAGGGHGVGTGF
jgi:hypothetical protein